MTEQFIYSGSDFCVIVVYDDPYDILDVRKFETTRIESLKSRNIPIISETRFWDSKRKISVRKIDQPCRPFTIRETIKNQPHYYTRYNYDWKPEYELWCKVGKGYSIQLHDNRLKFCPSCGEDIRNDVFTVNCF